MTRKDKLQFNKRRFLLFLIPFIGLSLLVGLMGHMTVKSRIKDINEVAINRTIDIADSYGLLVNNSNEMSRVVEKLVDEKLLLAAEAVVLIDREEITNKELEDLGKRLGVWRINLLSEEGEIIASNAEGNVGWRSYPGHPVQEFLDSNKKTHIEGVREGTINKEFSKFGYMRREDRSLVQIGIVEEDFHKFTRDFQSASLVDLIKDKKDIIHIFSVDMEGRILASSGDEEVALMEAQEIRKYLNEDGWRREIHIRNERDTLHTYVPVYSGNQKSGMLAIVWDRSPINSIIKETIRNTVLELLTIITIIASILYYAYSKNQSNLKIAYYDKLTGLPNKDYLQEEMESFIKDVDRTNKAVFLINLKNFKLINISYGYDYGDRVLVEVVNQIKELLNQNQKLFRFEADRFIILYQDYEKREDLEELAREIIAAENKTLDTKHRLEYLKLEVGIYEIKEGYGGLDKISKNMTFALNNPRLENKEIIFYNSKMEEESTRANKIEELLEDILEGINRDCFYLDYQPKLDVKTNKICGFEALARLCHKDLGYISPVEFISLAEERMLIYNLGLKVFERACVFLKDLEKRGYEDLSISINVSGIQILRDEFVEDIKRAASCIGVDMSKLEFEITESTLISNFELINKRLKEIKRLGIKVSIDDFGTGFSSFARLKSLNVDILKIDKYFIDGILEEDEESLISGDIISMGHRMGMKVVAEGVEEERQKDYLNKHGCDIIQGYLISKPLRKERALEFLEKRNK